MVAVMAKYNPFAEKAGMRKVAEQPPPQEARKVAETLHNLGFNTQLLGSQHYVLNRLQALSMKDLTEIRVAFIENPHPRFLKTFFPQEPFGKGKAYAEKMKTIEPERLAHQIKVCAMLLQTKVYLFWRKEP